MAQVLEYIKQNYTLFLFVAIIILLAVIGYYADKTNFGKKKNKEKDLNKVNSDGNNVIEETNNQMIDENSNLAVLEDELSHSHETLTYTPNSLVAETINKELNLSTDEILYNVEKIKKEEIESRKKEEEFARFSDEFDAILPKREIISDDLLSEIDDLELGKTQKFNLKDLKNFDNIKLPRISDTVSEEQEIWKL